MNTEEKMSNNVRNIRFAGAAQGFNWLPVFVADEHGIFARHGISIDYQKLGSVDKATRAVREGTTDLAITPPEGAVADFLSGGALRIVASNSERLPMSLVARPDIHTLDQLRGKRIGTSSLTEGTAIYTQLMLREAGLSYPDDYSFVLAGVHTTRWTALQENEIDAAPQPAPWNFLAERNGYNLLGEVADVIPEIIFAAIIGNEQWLDENRDTVQDLVSALSEAHDFVNDPANDAATLPIYQRLTTPDDPELAARGLTYTRDLGMWPAGLRVSPEALAATVEVMIGSGLIQESDRATAGGVVSSNFTVEA
jgi:ABC-type nitrate/sulfonate/bicarbonate transport system substrate-binding protein